MAPNALTQSEGSGRAWRVALTGQVVALRGRWHGNEPAPLLASQTPAIDEAASFPKSNKGRMGPDISGILSPTPRGLVLGATAPLERKMPIEDTTFGSITIDGKTYEHDVIIRLSGQIEKRRKKLSKETYGTSHLLSKEEAKFIYEDGSDLLIVGAGQEGNVRLSPEAREYFEKKGCAVTVQPTPEAIQSFNESRRKKIGLMHVTC